MVEHKRVDGRKPDQLREINAEVGIIKRADGSASFRMGKTWAIASVYGPRELYPAFLQNSETGILRCNYDMMSFSVEDRKRPGPSRRSVEISLVTRDSLMPVLDLSKFPNTVVDVFIMIPQADAGTRCAGITAAAMALADAGIPMKDLVTAVSVGKIENNIVVDLAKEEENVEDATDIPIAMIPRTKEITLLQLDGDITKEEFKKALDLAKKAIDQISNIQRHTLKKHYEEVKE